tara:strand:+ start:6350 stop:6541 length:192 start_codon:yes stop_codon:yes gene_type:complete
MSAAQQLIAQYMQKTQQTKSRKRPRETTTSDFALDKTTKYKTENKFENQPSELTPLGICHTTP